MSDEAKENLIQAAARQGEMNILVYGLKFNKSAIRQGIVDKEIEFEKRETSLF